MSQITNNLNSLSSTISINILGTEGAGYINLPPQTAEPDIPTTGYRFYSDLDNNLSWKNQSGNVFKLNTSATTTSRTWTLPDESSEILTTATISGNIPDGSPTVKGALLGLTNDFTASIGKNALVGVTSGVSNIAIGVDAGTIITTGSRNTILGNSANVDLSSGNDRIALGYNANATADGQLAIAPAITHISASGLTAAVDGTGTIMSFGSDGIFRPSAGTNNTVALIDTNFNNLQTQQTTITNDISTINSILSTVAYPSDYGAAADGITDDTAAIQAAINSGASVIKLLAATYIIAGQLSLPTGVSLIGAGQARTILQKADASSGHILTITNTTQKYDITISGITFDVNLIDSAISAEYVTRLKIIDCAFLNVPFWGIHLGVSDGTDTIIRNFDVTISNCRFDGATQTYEQLLIFNSSRVNVINCTFTSSLGGTPIGVGIYQVADNINLSRCIFKTIHIGLYYSISTNNIGIYECLFDGCSDGIQGANESDNGSFGATVVNNLEVVNSVFKYNAGVALDIGAVVGARVANCVFEYNVQSTININNGNSPVNSPPSNISISGCIFTNNNTSDVAHGLNPGILFSSPHDYYAVIDECVFQDTQTTPTQRHPISFSGLGVADYVTISNSRLTPYAGSSSVGQYDDATFGTHFIISNCTDVSTSLPTNIIASDVSLYELTSRKGAASGYAPLDSNSLVPVANIPIGTVNDRTGFLNNSYIDLSTKNTVVGRNAHINVTTALNNTCVGFDSLNSVTSGGANTAVGVGAASATTTGVGNVCIGYYANTAAAVNGSIVLGNVTSDTSNEMRVADTITRIRAVGLGTASDSTGTLLSFDASGVIRKAAGTNNTIALIDTALGARELTANKNQPSGYAGLDSDSLLDSDKLLRMYTGCSSSVWDGVTTFTQDSDVTISVDTTMTNDIICKVLTINAATTLTTAGYGIWCEKLVLNGIIANNGSNGSDGGVSAGTGGSGAPAATFGGGMPGGSADSNVAQPTAAIAYYGGTFASTFIGYGGGAGSIAAGGIGTSGTSNQNNSYYIWKRNPNSNTLRDAVGRYIWAGSGGGAASGDGTNYGGSGGGGAGIVFISAKTITGTGVINAIGGNGGNATIGNCGGGGAGSGGVIIIHTLMNPADFTFSADVSGGTPGTGFGSGGTGSLSIAGIIRVFSPWTVALP